MIKYNFSRLVAINSLKRKKVYDAEIVVWIMEPNGKPPAAVYITYNGHQTCRLLPHVPQKTNLSYNGRRKVICYHPGLDEKPEEIKNDKKLEKIEIQNGAVVPFAKRANNSFDFPSALSKKHLFSGVFSNVQGRFIASLWICNLAGDNQKIYDINLSANSHASKNSTFLFFKKTFRQAYAIAYNATCYIARKFAKSYFQPSVKHFCIPNPERLGHLVANTDVFLSELKNGFYPDIKNVELYFRENQMIQDTGIINIKNRISNNAFYNLLSEKIKIRPLTKLKESVFESVWRKKNCIIESRSHGHRDIHNTLDATSPIIEIPESYIQKGKALLRQHGIKIPAKIALVHMRSEHHTQKQYKELANLESSRYKYRNVDVKSYSKTIKYLSSIGYSVIALGTHKDVVTKITMPVLHARKVCSEDWFDLYLASICVFFLGDTSGAYALPDLFRKPIIFTNFAPVGHVYSWSGRHITIFKKMIHLYDRKIIPVSHLLNSTLGYTIHMDKIDPDQFAYLDNTADEILAVTREMVARLQGNWTDTREDLVRQKKFWSRLPIGYLHKKINSRVGTDYLRKNAWLNM